MTKSKKFRTIDDLYRRPHEDDRTLFHLAASVSDFRRQFGHWPTRLKSDPDYLRALGIMLTSEALAAVTSKLEFVPTEGLEDVIAEDGEGHSWSYGGHPLPREVSDAAQWLWGISW